MPANAVEEDRRLLGRVIGGKLRIEEHLGSGSMGRVYRARHLSLDKDVAIKVLRESAIPDASRSKRFAHEARAASRLSHPNSVAILDFGEDGADKLLYIAMELLEGEDLQAVIDRGTLLGVDRICHIMIQALAALAAAHDAGIIHRDVKPSNIVLVRQRNDDGLITEVVKVCDFGVAKFSSSNTDTLDGRAGRRVVGTPLYMSPEQAVGDTLDFRTDVYSCGIIMYEMLTGQPTFTAQSPMGVLMKHVSEPVRPPSSIVPGVPMELEALILWTLEKERNRRPSTARDLRNALRAFLAGKAGTIRELESYGVQMTPDEDPWTGPTPFFQLDLPRPPSTAESPLLPAPKLPSPPPRNKPNSGVATTARGAEHQQLVADLDLGAEAAKAKAAVPVSPVEPAPFPLPGPPEASQPAARRPSSSGSKPPASEVPSNRVGLRVPAELRGSSPDVAPAPWEERSEIFSEQSYFQVRQRVRERVTTTDVPEIAIDAPPPRSLSKMNDSDLGMAPAARDKMASYLWERFGFSPERRVPPDGFWFRDAQEREVGPLTWTELTHALRMETGAGAAEEAAVSSDQSHWIAAARFVHLTGVEAILSPDERLPEGVEIKGSFPQGGSVASALASIPPKASGRLMFRVRKERRWARFDVHVDKGRPTFVFTNEPQLQLPNLLVFKGIMKEDTLPGFIRTVITEAIPLEEAVNRSVAFDVATYRSAIMKERLRSLLRWPEGQFAFDRGGRPASRQSFASSLLTLLPDLVYRTLPSETLETELEAMMEGSVSRAQNADEALDAMSLTRSQRGVAERLLSASSLPDVIPESGRVRKAYTTMAYVLREIGLLILDR